MKTKALWLTATVWLGMKVIGFAQPAVIQFSSAHYTVNEAGGVANITVEITWSDSFNVYAVDFATSSGTATAGTDYSERSGTLSFEYPETNKTFTIPILDDSLAEGDETLLLTLSNPAFDGTLGRSNALLTIQDDRAWVVDEQFTRNIRHAPGQSIVVQAFALQPDGKALVGGLFGSVNGMLRTNLV